VSSTTSLRSGRDLSVDRRHAEIKLVAEHGSEADLRFFGRDVINRRRRPTSCS
jgi:hypothetical protein